MLKKIAAMIASIITFMFLIVMAIAKAKWAIDIAGVMALSFIIAFANARGGDVRKAK